MAKEIQPRKTPQQTSSGLRSGRAGGRRSGAPILTTSLQSSGPCEKSERGRDCFLSVDERLCWLLDEEEVTLRNCVCNSGNIFRGPQQYGTNRSRKNRIQKMTPPYYHAKNSTKFPNKETFKTTKTSTLCVRPKRGAEKSWCTSMQKCR